jgi:hypothetical protein
VRYCSGSAQIQDQSELLAAELVTVSGHHQQLLLLLLEKLCANVWHQLFNAGSNAEELVPGQDSSSRSSRNNRPHQQY